VQSVLTIEVHPWRRTVVQVRGKANARPSGWPLELRGGGLFAGACESTAA